MFLPSPDEPKDSVDYFNLRKEGKIYVSKIFKYSAEEEDLRTIRTIYENSDQVAFTEVQGALQLRISGKGKNQVAAVVTQEGNDIRRLTISKLKKQKLGGYEGSQEESFTFSQDQFGRMLQFLQSLEFIDLTNIANFQIEDRSTAQSRKTIVDKSDADLLSSFSAMEASERVKFLAAIKGKLSNDEVSLLLGRKETLEQFRSHIQNSQLNEKHWQEFFEKNFWIFGYGLDYRIMKLFDREMVVGSGGTANREKPIVDFLCTFSDFTTLVEIKKPSSKIFSASDRGRAGTASFSTEFIDAISQVLEQKAEWLSFAQSPDNYNKAGDKRLLQRTRDSKLVLVYGSNSEFESGSDLRHSSVMRDTFELFRRENRNIEILTFDELFDRANFIVQHKST